jgi:hypothetical protein
MALWHFVVTTVLLGTLLVYTSILTRRIGRINAALERVEVALLASDRGAHPATIAVAPTRSPEVSGKHGDAGYLGIRNLKGGTELPSSRATPFPGGDAVSMSPESRNALTLRFDLISSPGTVPVDETPVRASRGRDDTLNMTPALVIPAPSPVAASSATCETPNTHSELPSSPGTQPASGDASERRHRDTLLYLSNQRRRRRAQRLAGLR